MNAYKHHNCTGRYTSNGFVPAKFTRTRPTLFARFMAWLRG